MKADISTIDPKQNIIIKGAKLHNLKNIDVVIPRNKLVVITGLSGSGKSSLAFDTLYAEGQRRYVESLSSYARQFLGKLHKPKVDYIKGIAPAIAIEQKVISTFGIPGTMCAFLAILGLIYQRLIHYAITSHQEWKPGAKPLSSFTHIINSLQGISKVAPILSNICFYLLFAAVGSTADLSSAIVGGPSALVFASLALFVHSITVVCGTWIGMRLLLSGKSKLLNKKFGWLSSSWEEVLTASNAAIGGPSTASAFAWG